MDTRECASCWQHLVPGDGTAINDYEKLCDRCFDDGNFPMDLDAINRDPELDYLTDHAY